MYNWRDDIEDFSGENGEWFYDVMYELAAKEAGTNDENAIMDEMSNLVSVWGINTRSKLYDLLLQWYLNDEELLLRSVRSAVLKGDYLYFVNTQDNWSVDLLDGLADGQAERRFDDFVAKHS